MEKLNYKGLKLISQSEAIKRANAKIKRSMYDMHPGMISRWPKLNYAVGGAFRFGQTFYILGPSGSGKSYLLNMLRTDFVSKINEDYPDDYKILSFSFEMSADDEIIRTYSGRLGDSYGNLISSNKKINKAYYDKIVETSKEVDNDKIFYVETTGNRQQILDTVNKTAA